MVPMGYGDPGPMVLRSSHETTSVSRPVIVQGKPVARRGRKARDLPPETARPPRSRRQNPAREGEPVKANLARFTWAIMLLGSMALTVSAGLRWY